MEGCGKMIIWQKENFNIKTVYTVEYIDNKKDFDYVCSGKINHGEPWERYKKKVFTDAGEALSLYMLYLTYHKIYDVQLFEEIKIDDDTIRESYIEPNNTFLYCLKKNINASQQKQLENILKENTEHEKIIEKYRDFIKAEHAEKLFQDFIKELG